VRAEKIPEAPRYLGEFSEEGAAGVFEGGIGALSPIGVLGSPAKASREHSRVYIEDLADAMVEYIELMS